MRTKKEKKPKEFHLRSWLMNGLRSISRRYAPIYTVRAKAKEEFFVETKMGKQARRVRFECALCHNKVSNKEFRIDHINPIIPVTGFPLLPNGQDDWSQVINNLFCSEDMLQGICVQCHSLKTLEENKARKDFTKLRKLDNIKG